MLTRMSDANERPDQLGSNDNPEGLARSMSVEGLTDAQIAEAVARSQTIDPEAGVNTTGSLSGVQRAYAMRRSSVPPIEDVDFGEEADAFAVPVYEPGQERPMRARAAVGMNDGRNDDTMELDPAELSRERRDAIMRDTDRRLAAQMDPEELDGIDDLASDSAALFAEPMTFADVQQRHPDMTAAPRMQMSDDDAVPSNDPAGDAESALPVRSREGREPISAHPSTETQPIDQVDLNELDQAPGPAVVEEPIAIAEGPSVTFAEPIDADAASSVSDQGAAHDSDAAGVVPTSSDEVPQAHTVATAETEALAEPAGEADPLAEPAREIVTPATQPSSDHSLEPLAAPAPTDDLFADAREDELVSASGAVAVEREAPIEVTPAESVDAFPSTESLSPSDAIKTTDASGVPSDRSPVFDAQLRDEAQPSDERPAFSESLGNDQLVLAQTDELDPPVVAAPEEAAAATDTAPRTIEIDRTRDEGLTPAVDPVLDADLIRPRKVGNRGFGTAMAILATILFAVGLAFGLGALRALATERVNIVAPTMEILPSAEFWLPAVGVLLLSILWALIVNRSGWGAWVLGGFIIGLAASALYITGIVLQTGLNTGTYDFNTVPELLRDPMNLVGMLVTFILAREVVTWIGGLSSVRGRRLTKRHAREMVDYDEQVAARDRQRELNTIDGAR